MAEHALLEWLASMDGDVDRIESRSLAKEHRAIYASEHIKKGDIIMSVPHECIITLDTAYTCSALASTLRANSPITSTQAHVCVFLLEQRKKKEDSLYHAYIDALPQELACMPVLFSEEQLQSLQGSPLLNKVVSRRERYKDDYALICQLAPGFAQVASLREFIWGRMIVQSRIFGFFVDGQKTSGMVPGADLVNHGMVSNALWSFREEIKCFVLTAKDDLVAGQEILDSYGKRSHSGYFLDYGMVVQPNHVYETRAEANLEFGQLLYYLKYDLLGNQSSKRARLTRVHTDAGTKDLFNFLRIANAGAEDLYHLQAAQKRSQQKQYNKVPRCSAASSKRGRPDSKSRSKAVSNEGEAAAPAPEGVDAISLANERLVVAQLRAMADEAVAKYSRSAEDAQALLCSNEAKALSYNERNCIQVCLGEQLVWRYYSRLGRLLKGGQQLRPEDVFTADDELQIYKVYHATVLEPLSRKRRTSSTTRRKREKEVILGEATLGDPEEATLVQEMMEEILGIGN